MNLTYKNDSLLFNEKSEKEFINTNDAKVNKKIMLPFGVLNLYSALVKSLDFRRFHLNSIPYCKIDTKVIKKYLDKKLVKNDFLIFRKLLAAYCCVKKIKIENLRKWKDYNAWPFIALRVIAHLHENELECLSNLLLHTDGFINLNKGTICRLPIKLSEILTEPNAYLIGAVFGDGGFCLTNQWTIVDGGKKEEIIDSYNYLTKIKRLFIKLYGINHFKLRQRGNRIELIISRKDFGRFLNFFFGVPFGKKKNRIQKPKILTYSKKVDELNKLFWRGLFDTDGHCNKKHNSISFNSATLSFVNECINDLNKCKIFPTEPNKEGSYSIYIKSEQCNIFAENIGFSHPRKKRYLLNMLKRGCGKSKLISINRQNLYKSYFDLRKIKNLRIYGSSEAIEDINQQIGASIIEILNWKEGKGVSFIKLCELCLLNNVTIDNLYSGLDKNKNKIRFGLSGRGNKKCRVTLPIKLDKDILELAKYFRPYTYEARIIKEGNNKEIIKRFENIFNSKIVQIRDNINTNLSKTVIEYFKTFFIYDKHWRSYTYAQIVNLDKKLESIWD